MPADPHHLPSPEGCVPDLVTVAKDVEVVDDGWDSAVVIVEGQTVVRAPRRPEVQVLARREIALLDLVAQRVPVAVPRLVLRCAQHGSTSYRLVAGTPLDTAMVDAVGAERVAAQLGAFLEALWAVPVDEVRALGLEAFDLRPAVADFADRVLGLVGDPAAADLLADAAARLGPVPDGVLVHGDLGPAHVVCDENGVTGIIDWTDAGIGHPAHDLAWLLNGCDRRLRAPLVERLSLDAETVERADVQHALGPWWEVVHGLDLGDDAIVASGLSGIRARLPTRS